MPPTPTIRQIMTLIDDFGDARYDDADESGTSYPAERALIDAITLVFAELETLRKQIKS